MPGEQLQGNEITSTSTQNKNDWEPDEVVVIERQPEIEWFEPEPVVFSEFELDESQLLSLYLRKELAQLLGEDKSAELELARQILAELERLKALAPLRSPKYEEYQTVQKSLLAEVEELTAALSLNKESELLGLDGLAADARQKVQGAYVEELATNVSEVEDKAQIDDQASESDGDEANVSVKDPEFYHQNRETVLKIVMEKLDLAVKRLRPGQKQEEKVGVILGNDPKALEAFRGLEVAKNGGALPTDEYKNKSFWGTVWGVLKKNVWDRHGDYHRKFKLQNPNYY